jgi:hypothetical protein
MSIETILTVGVILAIYLARQIYGYFRPLNNDEIISKINREMRKRKKDKL